MKTGAILGVVVLAALALGASPASAVNVGDPAPEVDAKEWFNTPGYTLAQLRGKIVVVEFWATWCGPCVRSIPHLIELHEKYHSQGLVILGLTDQSKAEVSSFVTEKMKMTYAVGTGSSTSNRYGVTGIPHAFLVDPSGKVVWHGHPASGLDGAITSALQKTPPVLVDPAEKARSVKLLAEAQKAEEQGKLPQAIEGYQKIAAAKGAFDEKTAAQEKLKTLQARAAEEVQAAVGKAAAAPVEGLAVLKELQDRYAGLEAAKVAQEKITELGANPEVAKSLRAAQYEVEAGKLLASGRKSLEQKDFANALKVLERVEREYGDTASGKEAKAEADKIRNDKALMGRLAASQDAKRAESLLRMAKSYIANNSPDLARQKLEELIKNFGDSEASEQAKELLLKLK